MIVNVCVEREKREELGAMMETSNNMQLQNFIWIYSGAVESCAEQLTS